MSSKTKVLSVKLKHFISFLFHSFFFLPQINLLYDCKTCMSFRVWFSFIYLYVFVFFFSDIEWGVWRLLFITYNEAKQCNQKFWSNFRSEMRLRIWIVEDKKIELKNVSANHLFRVIFLADFHFHLFHNTFYLNEQWTASMNRTNIFYFVI